MKLEFHDVFSKNTKSILRTRQKMGHCKYIRLKTETEVQLGCDDDLFTSLIPHNDRLCGLVVRVSGYRYRGPGFDPRRYQIF